GGELQRVLLAFALDPMPQLLLLDEPVSAVDRRGIESFYEVVTSLREEYHMPILLVSHDLNHVRKYATDVVLLDQSVILAGKCEEVMASPEIAETFGLS
ncbi:MAG: metal ABC transporter ATP-binding protein, partial [Clostridia bacterium]|nr:metal ABC transporter ATP-binding protein [Clostridia bacterium]